MNDKISVVIPVYNKEKYVSATLDSIIAQSYENIEIVIVNDGSSDNTASIIDDYASKCSKIKVIHKENGGVTSARLRGIEEATGEWIGFVDADDYVEPQMYEKLMDNALKYNTDISHCGCQMVSPDGANVTYYHNTGRLAVQDHIEGLRDIVCGNVYEPGLCNKIYKKELFGDMVKNDLMDRTIKINEDLLMNYYLFKEADTSVFEDVCPYHYISTENSASKTKFTTDPLKVLKIIYEDIDCQLKDIIFSRICVSYVSYSTMTLRSQKELRKPFRKEIRKELRSRMGKIMKSKISNRIKLMSLWAAIWPWSYGFVHRTYSKIKGTYSEYALN